MENSVDWHKQIGKIWAENCFWTVNDVWFSCTYLKIRLIPDYGSLNVYYGFQESEGPFSYAHRLKIERVEDIGLKGSFKIDTDHETIKTVELYGVESYDERDNLEGRYLNELLITTNNYKLLIIPDWTTSIGRFTFDKSEIEDYLAFGWRELMGYKQVKLKRIKETLHNQS